MGRSAIVRGTHKARSSVLASEVALVVADSSVLSVTDLSSVSRSTAKPANPELSATKVRMAIERVAISTPCLSVERRASSKIRSRSSHSSALKTLSAAAVEGSILLRSATLYSASRCSTCPTNAATLMAMAAPVHAAMAHSLAVRLPPIPRRSSASAMPQHTIAIQALGEMRPGYETLLPAAASERTRSRPRSSPSRC